MSFYAAFSDTHSLSNTTNSNLTSSSNSLNGNILLNESSAIYTTTSPYTSSLYPTNTTNDTSLYPLFTIINANPILYLNILICSICIGCACVMLTICNIVYKKKKKLTEKMKARKRSRSQDSHPMISEANRASNSISMSMTNNHHSTNNHTNNIHAVNIPLNQQQEEEQVARQYSESVTGISRLKLVLSSLPEHDEDMDMALEEKEEEIDLYDDMDDDDDDDDDFIDDVNQFMDEFTDDDMDDDGDEDEDDEKDSGEQQLAELIEFVDENMMDNMRVDIISNHGTNTVTSPQTMHNQNHSRVDRLSVLNINIPQQNDLKLQTDPTVTTEDDEYYDRRGSPPFVMKSTMSEFNLDP